MTSLEVQPCICLGKSCWRPNICNRIKVGIFVPMDPTPVIHPAYQQHIQNTLYNMHTISSSHNKVPKQQRLSSLKDSVLEVKDMLIQMHAAEAERPMHRKDRITHSVRKMMNEYISSTLRIAQQESAAHPARSEDYSHVDLNLMCTSDEDIAVRLDVFDSSVSHLHSMNSRGIVQRRCYQAQTSQEDNNLFLFSGHLKQVSKQSVKVLYDSGASECFVPLSLVQKHGHSVRQTRRKIKVTVADGKSYLSDTVTLVPL